MVERNGHWLVSQGDLDFSPGLFPVSSVLSHLNSLGFSLLVCKMKGFPKGPTRLCGTCRLSVHPRGLLHAFSHVDTSWKPRLHPSQGESSVICTSSFFLETQNLWGSPKERVCGQEEVVNVFKKFLLEFFKHFQF